MKGISRAKMLHRRRGLTLIELIAALVLLGVLLTALTGLIPKFSARAIDRDGWSEAMNRNWSRVALERLADDLVNARSANVGPDMLQLTGTLARDASTGWMTDRDDTCTYRIIPWEGQNLLIREQAESKELLGYGHVSLTVEPPGDQTAGEPLMRLPAQEQTPKTMTMDLPPQLRVSIQTEEGETLASVLVVRQSIGGKSLQARSTKP